ncbi:TrbI/VirB10 family protein [Notoacmeibacter ruber]|uniref:Conjugal transfer protein n=1 Tax=Notoacmeibacter ruber TaxID=2670375 RepID=A0A3L7J8X9_9HYPH|nr:TrbI/VirB10 family protein [Notoacmeibacter ruber]RLQ84962.1 conjugal transfer protein [Notoacmeibacter ruber]
MSESDDLNERLKALENDSDRKRSASRMSPLAAIAVIALIALFGFLAFLFLQDDDETQFATSQPSEFQAEGEGFGEIEPFPKPEPAPAPQVVVQEVAPDPNDELLARIESLQEEIERLRNTPAPAPDNSAQDAAITRLTNELLQLQAANQDAQAEFQRQLAERDRQMRQLQADLDLAKLNNRPTAPIHTSAEDARLAELERRRREAEEFFKARVDSDSIAYGGTSGATSAAAEAAENLLDSATNFVRNGAARAEVTQAASGDPANTVPQGTMIQAALETAIDSTLPGDVRAIVSEDVHSHDGTRILIPRGSRLLGRYQSGVELAQERITVAWDRIIMPTNQTVEISAFGGDELGRSGVTGFVDTHFAKRFGSAALISLIGAGSAYATASLENDDASDALDDVSGNAENATDNVVGEYLSIGPTIHVDQGATVTVMVDRDLEIF